MTHTLLTIFPKPQDLLALEPEELGGVILELLAPNATVVVSGLAYPLQFSPDYPPEQQKAVQFALAEAASWLVSQGLLLEDPEMKASTPYRMTRRAVPLRNRTDVERYRKGRILPKELLQPHLAEKVWPMFLRGDHDVAVFQAFKDVEVTVRAAANAKGAGYADDLVGTKLMSAAFHPENGPLRNASAVSGERQAEMNLFCGAIGHAKNPVSHRDVNQTPEEAARLLIFASHLLWLVEQR